MYIVQHNNVLSSDSNVHKNGSDTKVPEGQVFLRVTNQSPRHGHRGPAQKEGKQEKNSDLPPPFFKKIQHLLNQANFPESPCFPHLGTSLGTATEHCTHTPAAFLPTLTLNSYTAILTAFCDHEAVDATL